MDSIPLCTTTSSSSTPTASSFTTEFPLPSFSNSRISKNLSFAKRNRKVSVFASKDEPPPRLDKWDQMELKFGMMLGEDPKLTLAKIMARKSNPDMSYLEIEKSLGKKNGKSLNNDIKEVPFDVSGGKKRVNSLDGLNLVRPVPKKGVKFETNEKPFERREKKPSQPDVKSLKNSPSRVPNVILRKPSLFNDDSENSSRLNIIPNLSLRMGKETQKERFSDITLLKKPEPLKIDPVNDRENDHSVGSQTEVVNKTDDDGVEMNDVTHLGNPEPSNHNLNGDQCYESSRSNGWSSDVNVVAENSLNYTNLSTEMVNANYSQSVESTEVESGEDNESTTGTQPSDLWSSGKSDAFSAASAAELANSNPGISVDDALLGKPKRLEQSAKATSNVIGEFMEPANPESRGNAFELENFLASPLEECEENDWKRAEDLVMSGGREEVEVINSSARGFAVSFGFLIGFLPYRNLAAKWKFLAFESWLRRRGLDPSKYKQSLGVIGSFESAGITPSESRMGAEIDHLFDGEISPDMKLEDLLRIYDQEKLKFLSSFVGQKIKVTVVLADRRSRQLIFSIKPKEKEELIEKKRNLMGKLSVGDVVKCCIKKITYFGIFVEVEGVPALIHQTEVSWDATLDLASYFRVGQIVEAKVHQLDFSLERIFLSLKDLTPDPMVEALEAVAGDHDSLGRGLEAAQADTEWTDVESLIKELQQVEGIQSVSKGRYFFSPGLAPNFQVYLASMFDNEYKLLARSGNRAQEVIVQTSLSKEEIKSAILTCTNRVQ